MDYEELMASHADAVTAGNDSGTRSVIGWVSTASVETRDLVDVGSWGGFMTEADRWNDHIANIEPKFVAHHEALRRAINAKGLRRGGDWHQRASDGVLVFGDGAIGTFSFRAWGDLMAATWVEEDRRGYGYMHFYKDSCLEDAGIALSPALGPSD